MVSLQIDREYSAIVHYSTYIVGWYLGNAFDRIYVGCDDENIFTRTATGGGCLNELYICVRYLVDE